MITRRDFLKYTAVAGMAAAMPMGLGVKKLHAAAVSPALLKWVAPLRGLTALGDPNGIPVAVGAPDPVFANTNLYQITIGEFTDTLHPGLPPTKLRGYWDTTNPVKRHLGGLIIATKGTASRLRFTNTLPAGPSIIPNDPTVQTIPGQPTTENRVAVHLHGGFVPWISDGGPFNFWDAAGASGASFLNGPGSVLDNIPGNQMSAGQADYFYPNDQSTRLMWYHDHAYGITRTNAYAGVATGYVMIDPAQEAALGNSVPTNNLTNLGALIPLVFQDKKFVNAATIAVQDPTWSLVARPDVQTTGSLWYEHVYNPREFKLLTGANFLPVPDPSAIPEFFGDTMLCNGTVQPFVSVEQKRYRFMMLNACNARFLNINLLKVAPNGELTTNPKTLLPINSLGAGPNMVQIGTEGGYLVKQVVHTNNTFFNPITNTGNMLLGPAERSDFIIDFSAAQVGDEFIMYNDAPGPFPAGPPTTDYFIGNTKNPAMVGVLPGETIDTRNILKFKVVPLTAPDPSTPFNGFPASMPREPFLVPYPAVIPAVGPIAPLTPPGGATIRNLTLNEDFDAYGRLRQLVGTTTPVPVPGRRNALAFGLEYGATATETPVSDAIEVWNIYNLTADTHPMHFHLVDVQILQRAVFTMAKGVFTITAGTQRGPELDELGYKETCKMHPGEVITVCMQFKMPAVPFIVPFSTRGMGAGGAVIPQANEYVWHCHILEHEEHDMMRPLVVQGQNPQSPNITPTAASAVTPIIVDPLNPPAAVIVAFTVTVAAGKTFTVTSTNAAYPAVQTPAGFTVTVLPAAVPPPAAIPVTYTVTDNTNLKASVVLTIT